MPQQSPGIGQGCRVGQIGRINACNDPGLCTAPQAANKNKSGAQPPSAAGKRRRASRVLQLPFNRKPKDHNQKPQTARLLNPSKITAKAKNLSHSNTATSVAIFVGFKT